MTFNVADIESYKGSITKPVEGYIAGVEFQAKGSSGVQQIDDFNDEYIIATRRTAAGKLELAALLKIWLTW
jgi:hypothetical protein